MEKNRPTISNPQEWALIRSMYFNDKSIDSEVVDPIERLERMESKERNQFKSSR